MWRALRLGLIGWLSAVGLAIASSELPPATAFMSPLLQAGESRIPTLGDAEKIGVTGESAAIRGAVGGNFLPRSWVVRDARQLSELSQKLLGRDLVLPADGLALLLLIYVDAPMPQPAIIDVVQRGDKIYVRHASIPTRPRPAYYRLDIWMIAATDQEIYFEPSSAQYPQQFDMGPCRYQPPLASGERDVSLSQNSAGWLMPRGVYPTVLKKLHAENQLAWARYWQDLRLTSPIGNLYPDQQAAMLISPTALDMPCISALRETAREYRLYYFMEPVSAPASSSGSAYGFVTWSGAVKELRFIAIAGPDAAERARLSAPKDKPDKK